MTPRAGGAACALAAALVLGLAAAAAGATDPARAALAEGDSYASPRALGAGARQARARLVHEAARLAGRGQDVKLAVVAGPAGAPTMRAYVSDLRTALEYEGTLVVTAPGRAVIAEGPRTPAEITLALRAAHVNRIPDPVERAIKAARAAAPPAPAGSSLKGVIGLTVLAVLGGAWAAAWGVRRERRHAHVALVDARALARLRLDALGAHARALEDRPGLPARARRLVEGARAAHDDALAAIDRADGAEDVVRAEDVLLRGEHLVGEAAALAGAAWDPGTPFAGLCAVDPAHGPATARGPIADREGAWPLCARCAAAGREGDPPARRVVPVRGRPVPFDEAGLLLADGERS